MATWPFLLNQHFLLSKCLHFLQTILVILSVHSHTLKVPHRSIAQLLFLGHTTNRFYGTWAIVQELEVAVKFLTNISPIIYFNSMKMEHMHSTVWYRISTKYTKVWYLFLSYLELLILSNKGQKLQLKRIDILNLQSHPM